MPTVVLSVLASPPAPPGSGTRPLLLHLLAQLVALLAAVWAQAPSEPLTWRAQIALTLLATSVPRLRDEQPAPLPEGDLASLRAELRRFVTVLDWDAQGRAWWPGLRAQLELLADDIAAEISQREAA